jgi:cell division septation protein DedD
MTLPRLLVAVLALPLLLLPAAAQAQEADTTEAAPPAADTAATDTAPADTAAADTAAAATDPPTPGADTADPSDADTTAARADAPATDTLSAAARRERATEQARAAASSWLSLTDAGQFGPSWDAAAPTLQNGIPRADWIERGTQMRNQLDTLTARTLTRTEYRDSTRQIPGGQPVVALQYRTEFANGSVLEAVITTKPDTAWTVAGYRVVPNPDSVRAADTTQAQAEPDTTQSP